MNPTQEEMRQFLQRLDEDPFSLQPGEQRWLCRFALHALSMVKEVRKILESPCGVEQRRLVLAELAKFDEKEVKSK